MFCPNCGTKVEDGAVFCPECGGKIADAAVNAAPPEAVVADVTEQPAVEEPLEAVSEQPLEDVQNPAEYAEEQQAEEAYEEGEHSEEENTYAQPEKAEEQQPEEAPEEEPAPKQEERPAYVPPVSAGGNASSEPAYEGPIESLPVKLLKKSARTGSFLIAVLMFTASVVLTVLTLFQNRLTSETVEGLIGRLGSSVGEDISKVTESLVALFGGTIDSLGNTILITSLLAMVPAIITMIALWIIFGSALGRSNEKMGSAGFIIIKVIWIIKLVLTAILILGILVTSIILYSMYQGAHDVLNEAVDHLNEIPGVGEKLKDVLSADIDNIINTIFFISLAVFAAISAFVVFFQVKVITTLGAVQRTAETGDNRKKVSGFVAVVLFIGAFYSLHALPAVIISAILLPSQLFAAIAFCAEVAAYICFGIAIFSYRVKVRILNAAGKIE